MRGRAEAVVGAAIILGILLVFLGTLWLKGLAFGRNEITVRARFREVGQIMEGNSVKLRGVSIGRVEAIELEPGGEGVVVSMRIDGDAPLPAEPVVLLAPESMFGDWQAEIFPRDRFPSYTYAEGPDPQVLPGYALPDISRLTAVADRIAENLAVLTERVELAFTEETALNIRQVIENIEDMSTHLSALVATQERTVEEVAANLQRTSGALGETAEMIRRTFGQVEAAVSDGALEAIVDNIEHITVQLDSVSAVLLASSTQFRSTVASADTTFQAVEAVALAVAEGEGTLGRLVRDTSLYSRLVETNRAVQELLEDFRANPRKYIRLEIF